MYIDLIILGLIIAAVVICFRKFNSFVYVVAIIDITLRLLSFLANNLGVPEIVALIKRIDFPVSIPAIIDKYTNGIVTTVIMWCFFGVFVIFDYYVIRTFWKKRK
ncbi:MAG: hypothetical protein RSA48_02125 [Bacilli bacterium]